MNEFTSPQQRAIAATGNILVVAGAGAGKTRTLVERCVARVLDAQSPVGLDEILMVTFTEAAAAEMKLRIRQRLEDELDRHPPRRMRRNHYRGSWRGRGATSRCRACGQSSLRMRLHPQ